MTTKSNVSSKEEDVHARCTDKLSAENQAELVHQFLCQKWLKEGVEDEIRIILPCSQYKLFPSLLIAKTANSRISYYLNPENSESFSDYFVSKWDRTEIHNMAMGWGRHDAYYKDSFHAVIYPDCFYLRALKEYYCFDAGTIKDFGDIHPYYIYALGKLYYFERFTYNKLLEILNGTKSSTIRRKP